MILFKRATIIGVGLLGGSLAASMIGNRTAAEVVGAGSRRENLGKALDRGFIHKYYTSTADAVVGSDLVVMASPLSAFVPIMGEIAPKLEEGAIVTDVGSVKGSLVERLEAMVPDGSHFVGGHPIAGSHLSGVENADPALFRDRLCILTPTRRTPGAALEAVRSLWKGLGARVVTMDPMEHDRILAATSHLPHVAAFGLVNALDDMEGETDDLFSFVGDGFKDTTRVASGNPVMWRDVSMFNSEEIVASISSFISSMERIRDMIRSGDGEGLLAEFQKANRNRGRIR